MYILYFDLFRKQFTNFLFVFPCLCNSQILNGLHGIFCIFHRTLLDNLAQKFNGLYTSAWFPLHSFHKLSLCDASSRRYSLVILPHCITFPNCHLCWPKTERIRWLIFWYSIFECTTFCILNQNMQWKDMENNKL